MELYIVYSGEYEQRSIDAVFTTREKAERFMRVNNTADLEILDDDDIDITDKFLPNQRTFRITVYADDRIEIENTGSFYPSLSTEDKDPFRPINVDDTWRCSVLLYSLEDSKARVFEKYITSSDCAIESDAALIFNKFGHRIKTECANSRLALRHLREVAKSKKEGNTRQ